MDVIVTIQHPAHVHFFRNALEELEADGHDAHVFAREKDIALDLLDAYDVDHEVLAGAASGLADKAAMQLGYELRLLRRARRIDPDVMMAIGEPGVAHVAALVGSRSVIFTDSEHAGLRKKLVYPLADLVCSPEYYQDDLGNHHVRYPGYHELAYLHPDRFTPDPDVCEELGLDESTPLVVMRLVSWDASHDIGDSGFTDPVAAVERLEDAGARVAITSETSLPPAIRDNRISLPPDRIHDLLYHADAYLGESATMATESAILGTPAVFVSTFDMLGNMQELESEYDLVFSHNGDRRQERGVDEAIDIVTERDDERWRRRRRRLLDDKIDTTTFVLDVVAAQGSGDADPERTTARARTGADD